MGKEKYSQLCVWPAVTTESKSTLLSKEQELEAFFLINFGVRVKYKCEVKTLPDLDENGNPEPGTGGRNDLFFYIHTDDIMKFAVTRLGHGIRWWEDVIKYNDNSHLYTDEFILENPPTW